jgi:VIT1/CCC1 family predicted Fe2+/Mn2+ transporter
MTTSQREGGARLRPSARRARHLERHLSGRAGWLRAAVLGADDAIVSTASLMLGVAASSASSPAILTAGVAGLFAGALSMAVGEFVSVGSQRDAERADVEREKKELAAAPDAELQELAGLYKKRGLDDALALQVARALSAHDRLGAHLHDELGIEPGDLANPFQAAWISAASFATFALVPIGGLAIAPASLRLPSIALTSLLALASLGALGGHLGGAPKARAALRVTLGGALAMGVTAGIGHLLGQALG